MVQSTFVPSLISIEVVFIVLYQFELVTGDFSMKTAIFHKMLMKEWVNAFFTSFPFVFSNGKKMPYLGPQHLFLFEKRCLKK
jgi:hypothetical protein